LIKATNKDGMVQPPAATRGRQVVLEEGPTAEEDAAIVAAVQEAVEEPAFPIPTAYNMDSKSSTPY
jgi:hypothetical protein